MCQQPHYVDHSRMRKEISDCHMMHHMLTTTDNPFDPFTQYDEWYSFDSRHGYHTPELLARVAIVSDEVSDVDESLEIEEAIDEIVEAIDTGLYKKVSKETKEAT